MAVSASANIKLNEKEDKYLSELEVYDVAVIGGGINGVGIAADAALRGLSVILFEQNDLASATSSASTKLIHGGLRYLEYYEFRLVREGLKERDILLNNAKHLVKPLTFLLPYKAKTRSLLQIRLGLFCYDHLARHSTLPKTKLIKFRDHSAGALLKPEYKIGFQYSDCKTDDSRLVIANALQAKQHGAEIFTYTECIKATRHINHWEIVLKNRTGHTFTKKCKVLINATGPWAEEFLKTKIGIEPDRHISLVKGSHILVPRFYQQDIAFLFQHIDNRVLFVIPYLSKFNLIGTTDVSYQSSPGPVCISQEEINYLLNAVNTYFSHQIRETDIVHTYSGLRPLLESQTENPAAITRDYAIEVNCQQNAPLISLFGGKLTTYRKVSEKVVDCLQPFFKDLGHSKTLSTVLPGANYESETALIYQLNNQFPWLDPVLLDRYIHQYGNDTFTLLADCENPSDLGEHFGDGLFQREVDYLVRYEWAINVDDILWRRTKLGYFYPEDNLKRLMEYMNTSVNA